MISYFRKFAVLGILFGLMLLTLNIGSSQSLIYPKMIAILGFIILASSTIGDLFQSLSLPRVLGYLICGALFGLPFFQLSDIPELNLMTEAVVGNLTFVANIALSFIAFSAGLELKRTKVSGIYKNALLTIGFKVFFVSLFVGGGVFVLFPLLSETSFTTDYLLFSGILISVLAMGSSVEFTKAASYDEDGENRLLDFTMGTVAFKEIFNLLLIAGSFYFLATVHSFTSPSFSPDYIQSILSDLLLSLLAGMILGILTISYVRLVKSEISFFLIVFVMAGSYGSTLLNLQPLIVFLVAGIVSVNFTKDFDFKSHIINFNLPVFLVFFTLLGASLNFCHILPALFPAFILFLLRVVAIYISVKFSSGITEMSAQTGRYGWAGFISPNMTLTALILLTISSLSIGSPFVTGVIYDFFLLNLFLGPLLFKLALVLNNKPVSPVFEEKSTPEPEKEIVEKLETVEKDYRIVFSEPNFIDPDLNKILFDLYFKVVELANEFRDTFISKRNFETEEILNETIALYRNMFSSIESILLSGKEPRAIKSTLQSLRINQTEVLLHKLDERKNIEREFANSDTLIKRLLNEVMQLTDGLSEEYPLDVEIDYATYSKKPVSFQFFILKLKVKAFFQTFFTGRHEAVVKVNLKNIARYYLNSKATHELLETLNLTGADRLNLFRKLKAIHKNYISYLDELILLIGQERSSLGFVTVFFMRYEELKAMFFNELDVYNSEQSSTVQEIEKRLSYAFASPYNSLLDEIADIMLVKKRGDELNFLEAFENAQLEKEKLLDSIRYWVIYYQGIIGLIQKELYIYRFEIQLNNFIDRALLNLADEVSDRIRAGCPKVADQFRTFSKELGELIPLGYSALKIYSDSFRMSFAIPELTSLIRDLEKTARSRKIRTFFDTLINGIKSVSLGLPEESVFLDESELVLPNRTPEFKELKTYKIRSLTSHFLLLKLPREIGEVNEFLVNYIDGALKEIRNLESSINYYFDSMVKRLQEDPDDHDSVKAILESLDENFISRLREIENNNDKLELAINKQVASKTAFAVTEVKRLISLSAVNYQSSALDSEKFRLKVYYSLRKVKVLTKRFFRSIYISVKHTLSRFVFPLFKRGVENLKYLSGRLTVNYREDLFKTQEILNSLPFIYRRLFDGTSLESSELFLGKDEIKSIVNQAKERFKAKLPASILITGAPGSGKTSYIYYIKKDLLQPGEYIELYFLERISTVDELRRLISDALGYNELKTVEAIIIDLNERFRNKFVLLINLNKTFVRTVDGFEALKTMLYIISMTSSNVLWVATIQSIGWQFIKTNFKAASLFNFSVSLEELNKHRIKDIILHRQHTTGFAFRFTRDDLYLLRKRLFKSSKPVEDQSYLEQVYFERLTEYADGNIVAGMNYWLNSISKIEENTLVIHTYKSFPLIDLSFLDISMITVLYTVMLHGGLKRSQLAQSLNISEKQAGEYLEKLLSLNLLRIGELSKSHDYYYINKFKFKSVQNELQKRNILPW